MAKTAKTARSARKPAYASKTDNGQPREEPPDEITEDEEDGLGDILGKMGIAYLAQG